MTACICGRRGRFSCLRPLGPMTACIVAVVAVVAVSVRRRLQAWRDAAVTFPSVAKGPLLLEPVRDGEQLGMSMRRLRKHICRAAQALPQGFLSRAQQS